MVAFEVYASALRSGATVSFRPRGNSMQPLIYSGDHVTVEPVTKPETLHVGDIVLARVAGKWYLHLISAVDHPRKRVQISNNRGRVNGWTSHTKVYGRVVRTERQ